MFGFEQDFDQDNDFGTCVHLRDFADSLDVDTTCAFGLSSDMETEQLESIKETLEAAIAEALANLERSHPACHIGPYANNICTICGGRQPS